MIPPDHECTIQQEKSLADQAAFLAKNALHWGRLVLPDPRNAVVAAQLWNTR
jgi:hypothetical protein